MRRQWLPMLAVLCLPSAVACGSRPAPAPAPAPTLGQGEGRTVAVELGDRPFRLHIPPTYRDGTNVPVVLLLHGYTISAAAQESYFKLTSESDRRGFLYAMPDGTRDSDGNRFWNATDACCDLHGSTVDDSAYLGRLLDLVKASYSVDARRVYVVGHSNGGFMAYRMACDHANEITAIVSLAGAMWNDVSRCAPTRPVSVLEIHGTADQSISFDGGVDAGHGYPSTATTVQDWRSVDGCDATADAPKPPIDLVADLAGPETTVTTYASGCRNATSVALWTIQNGQHVPAFNDGFAGAIMDFLYAHTSASA